MLIIAPMANRTSETEKVSCTPNFSVVQGLINRLAVIVAKKAVAMNWTWSCPTPKAPITSGTATLTILLVRTAVENADNTVTVTSHG